MATGIWDADTYEADFGFVTALGRGLLDLVDARPGQRILDLGCGTGELAAELAATGAAVRGIDADDAMIAKARRDHPEIPFEVADGHRFEVADPFDAVLSNAALHWMLDPDAVIGRVHAALRPGGRFVAEFGGTGNVATIHSALVDAVTDLGLAPEDMPDPWYFPSPAEHATRLESGGFRVRSIQLIDRPTPLAGGDDGLAGWIEMFGGQLLANIAPDRRAEVIRNAVQRCRPNLRQPHGWIADYVRLRFIAEHSG